MDFNFLICIILAIILVVFFISCFCCYRFFNSGLPELILTISFIAFFVCVFLGFTFVTYVDSSSYIVESIDYESYQTYSVTVRQTDYLPFNFFVNRKSFSFSVPDASMYYPGQEFTDLEYMKNYYIEFLS